MALDVQPTAMGQRPTAVSRQQALRSGPSASEAGSCFFVWSPFRATLHPPHLCGTDGPKAPQSDSGPKGSGTPHLLCFAVLAGMRDPHPPPPPHGA